jgi:hypothetical protein
MQNNEKNVSLSEKERKIIEELKKKIRGFLYLQQNHSIGNGYQGWYIPNSGNYLVLIHQFVAKDVIEDDYIHIACDELIKEGDMIVELENNAPTRVTLTKEAIFKYFH